MSPISNDTMFESGQQVRNSVQHPERDARKPLEDNWDIKTITFSPSGFSFEYRIIMQNNNGPCSFITICNILILRDQIVLPQDRESISFESLSKLVLGYIETTVSKKGNQDMSTKLRMISSSITGMSFNPKFTSIAFDQKAGEVALFTTLGIPLVHGWLVDPASHEEYAAVSRVVSYQSARDLISHVEHLSGSSGVGANANHAGLMDEIKENFRNAVAIKRFLDHSHSQLTSYGRSRLLSFVPPPKSPTAKLMSSPSFHHTSTTSFQHTSTSSSLKHPSTTSLSHTNTSLSHTSTVHAPPSHPELFALFRNSHVTVLCRHNNELYTLVTDRQFLETPHVVWQRLVDTERHGAVYFDSAFQHVRGAWDEFVSHFHDHKLGILPSRHSHHEPDHPKRKSGESLHSFHSHHDHHDHHEHKLGGPLHSFHGHHDPNDHHEHKFRDFFHIHHNHHGHKESHHDHHDHHHDHKFKEFLHSAIQKFEHVLSSHHIGHHETHSETFL